MDSVQTSDTKSGGHSADTIDSGEQCSLSKEQDISSPSQLVAQPEGLTCQEEGSSEHTEATAQAIADAIKTEEDYRSGNLAYPGMVQVPTKDRMQLLTVCAVEQADATCLADCRTSMGLTDQWPPTNSSCGF